MEKLIFVLAINLMIFINFSIGQKQDNTWVFGARTGASDSLLLADSFKLFWPYDFNFNHDPMKIEYDFSRTSNFRGSNSSLCDAEGNLYCYTNGRFLYDKDDNYAINGDTIGYGEAWEFWNQIPASFQFGLKGNQTTLLLPWPGKPDSVFYIVTKYNLEKEVANGWYWGIIDGYQSGSQPRVIVKDNVLDTGQLRSGRLMAVRHANGRDWWITFVSVINTHFFVYLLDPSGLKQVSIQDVGTYNIGFNQGSAAFSRDGSKYAMFDGNTYNTKGVLVIMEFDRCLGKFTRRASRKFTIPEYSIGQGVVFSPNGNYLYVNDMFKLYQIDMTKSNYPMIELATYDGFKSFPDPSFYETVFGTWVEGPDGRHYNVSGAGTAAHMHVIDYPNEAGEACRFKQHFLRIPFNKWTTPNFPNYRLGPLDGSPCDTLGLDNHPIAKYRYEGADTIDFRHIRFTDLSYLRPTRWVWDFGDGTGSLEQQSPYHRFARNGTYNVCLTVSNEYSSNTTCRLITLGTTSTTQDNRPVADISIFPNPAVDYFNLTLGDYVPARGSLTLYALSGVVVHTQRVYYGQNSVNITDLPTGMYVYRLTDEGQLIGEGKVVVR